MPALGVRLEVGWGRVGVGWGRVLNLKCQGGRREGYIILNPSIALSSNIVELTRYKGPISIQEPKTTHLNIVSAELISSIIQYTFVTSV